MKNYNIMAIAQAFRNVSGELKLPAPVAWKRRINHHRIMDACAIINEALNEVKTRYSDDAYSVEDENGRRVKPEYAADFTREQDEIMSQDTEIDIIMINIADIGDVEISDKDMDTVAFMINEQEV